LYKYAFLYAKKDLSYASALMKEQVRQ